MLQGWVIVLVSFGYLGVLFAIASHGDRRAEAAVIAVPHPHWGERPLAVVVLRPGASASAEELRDFLAPSVARYALPDSFDFVAEIPKTSTGKLQKSLLRERYGKALST